MKAVLETETIYNLQLQLNEEEAIELLGYMQNFHGEPGQETSALSRVRAHIFQELRKAIPV